MNKIPSGYIITGKNKITAFFIKLDSPATAYVPTVGIPIQSYTKTDVWEASWTSSLSPIPLKSPNLHFLSYFPLLHLSHVVTFFLDHSTDSKLTTYQEF